VHLLLAEGEPGPLETALGFLSIPLLVALNAFFVAAEFALVAVRKTRVEELVTHKIKGARSVATAIEHMNRTIAATQLGVTFSSLGLGWVAESILAQALAELGASWWAPWNYLARHSIAGAGAFFLVTFFHVVLGELFPKTLALQAPDRIALWVSRPLNIFVTLTRPFTLLMTGTGNLLVRMFGLRAASASMVHSVEELALLVEDTEEAGILDPDQAELVQNVFRLTKKSVADCMVPREKMAALELTAPLDRVLEIVRSSAHTRLPVYSGELNNIVGIVNTKNLFFLLSLRGVVVLEDALYPALFLKPDEEIANGLRLFKKAKRPMALVRDEQGRILGLITLEDILEEIIGDIEDEHDRPMPRAVRLKGVRVRKKKGT
jgi:CBS domain containing-hemolysin-like protein